MVKKRKRAAFEVGEVVLGGRYRIEELIHHSGMSNVYRVTDSQLGTVWALKEIRKSQAGTNKVEYRSLLNEVRLMKSLSHPSIPRIVSLEEDGDSLFIIMDYVNGKSIQQILASGVKFTQKDTITLMLSVAQVMLYLHSLPNPIVYRDMKPANIMIVKDGTIRILDFGISEQITEENQINQESIGSKGYTAPEQRKVGVPLDTRSDIFSFGGTMYSLLTGLVFSEVNDKPIHPRVIDSSISQELSDFVMKCYEPDLEKRYSSFEEVILHLQELGSESNRSRVGSWLKILMTGGLLVTSLAFGVLGWRDMRNQSTQREASYVSLIHEAEKNSDITALKKAIELFPDRIDTYFQLLDLVKEDGVFTKDEEDTLLGVVNPNYAQLATQSRFAELGYEVGRLYWFYGDGSEATKSRGTKWFYESREGSKEAEIMYNIGRFNIDIKSAVIDSKDAGMYREYFSNLTKAFGVLETDLMKVTVFDSTLSFISQYTLKLRQDGVSQQDLDNVVGEVEEMLKGVSSENERVLELKQKVESMLVPARSAIETTFRGISNE